MHHRLGERRSEARTRGSVILSRTRWPGNWLPPRSQRSNQIGRATGWQVREHEASPEEGARLGVAPQHGQAPCALAASKRVQRGDVEREELVAALPVEGGIEARLAHCPPDSNERRQDVQQGQGRVVAQRVPVEHREVSGVSSVERGEGGALEAAGPGRTLAHQGERGEGADGACHDRGRWRSSRDLRCTRGTGAPPRRPAVAIPLSRAPQNASRHVSKPAKVTAPRRGTKRSTRATFGAPRRTTIASPDRKATDGLKSGRARRHHGEPRHQMREGAFVECARHAGMPEQVERAIRDEHAARDRAVRQQLRGREAAGAEEGLAVEVEDHRGEVAVQMAARARGGDGRRPPPRWRRPAPMGARRSRSPDRPPRGGWRGFHFRLPPPGSPRPAPPRDEADLASAARASSPSTRPLHATNMRPEDYVTLDEK